MHNFRIGTTVRPSNHFLSKLLPANRQAVRAWGAGGVVRYTFDDQAIVHWQDGQWRYMHPSNLTTANN